MSSFLVVLAGVLIGVGAITLRGAFRSQDIAWKRPSVKTRSQSATQTREVVEAVAIWTEQLRDTISAATGLEQAIIATQNHAPPVLASHVQRLVAGIRYGSTEDALRTFADDVSHPTCDFVVAALITASQHQARDLAQLLTHLSECAREECRFHLRMWVSRARIRTATRMIMAVVVIFVFGLIVLNPAYLAPFLTTNGVFFLCVSGASFTFALLMLQRLARVPVPARFLSQRNLGVSP